MSADRAIAEAAEAIKDAAQEHKRLVKWHRQQAKQLWRSLAELEHLCKQLGIGLTIQGEEEMKSHGRQRSHP
jgi:hypothetical protein